MTVQLLNEQSEHHLLSERFIVFLVNVVSGIILCIKVVTR